MWLKWLPWRLVVRRVARAHGFLDPVAALSRLHRFAEPSEVAAPVELLRAGVVFHARGLMNTAAIQHNLDWIWPYWVERQFDPADESFIPRAFSITHVNLTHRNWTAVGLPDVELMPIVDPRGLVTPHWDGWSLDGWIVADDGRGLFPSKLDEVRQRWTFDGRLAVETECRTNGMHLESAADVLIESNRPVGRQTWKATSDRAAWLVVSLRPYNPEGVSFVHRVGLDERRRTWTIDEHDAVTFSLPVDRHEASAYRRGDVGMHLFAGDEASEIECDVGMATAAAMFRLSPAEPRTVETRVDLLRPTVVDRWAPAVAAQTRKLRATVGEAKPAFGKPASPPARVTWPQALAEGARLQVGDTQVQFLYDAAMHTLVLHSPGEVFPGPYTYKRFWVRDTAFIVHALLCTGLVDRAMRVVPHLLARQTRAGYFLSQEGEWDANGEALWTLWQCARLSGREPPREWTDPVRKAVEWIERKRLSRKGDPPHAGLLPAGFSAEHLGPNDYYYWDDFWAVGGLRAAAEMLSAWGDLSAAAGCRREANDLMAAIERSLQVANAVRREPGLPATCYRRMDSGAVGSLVAGYPLQLLKADDPRLLATVEFLWANCFVRGGFFQDMIHSGINPYLTLHVAQILMRAGDRRWIEPFDAVAGLASPTGQWPEAIHPRTGGGCMGDGQHAWAAAEWAMAVRNAFVREEGDRLILGSGVPGAWIEGVDAARFGPTPTAWGNVTVELRREGGRVAVSWEAAWRGTPPVVEVHAPGHDPQAVAGDTGRVVFESVEAG